MALGCYVRKFREVSNVPEGYKMLLYIRKMFVSNKWNLHLSPLVHPHQFLRGVQHHLAEFRGL